MESMYTFLSIIFIVFGVLQIILFFKFWGMTNNVAKLLNEVKIITGTKKAEIIQEIKWSEKELERAENSNWTLEISQYKSKLEKLQSELANIESRK